MIDLAEGTREVIEVSPEGAPEIIEVSSSRAGRAATVAIGVITTGAPGTSASVTNSGTTGEAVLDFTIPTGENVELRINGGYIQWKTTEAETWNNLIEIADITATIDIGTVTTGDPDTDVSVINSGSGKDAVFNISIPKGTTFTPSVSAEGVISFTNDGGLANPSSVDITGPQGIQGDPAPNTIFQYSVNGTDWTTVATGAHWYRQSGDNGVTWSEAIKLAITDYVDGKISQTITEGVEDKAPSEAAVFDALGLKIDSSDVAVTAGANKIPKADANGDIDSGWIKDATTAVKGVVKVGDSLSATSGVLSVVPASSTVKGVIELATDAEVIQGTDTGRAVTPAGLLAGFPTRLRSNLLGTVSQTDGVPTGAVIESGSNANGKYVKFADGTLECYFFQSVTDQAIAAAYGSLYIGSRTWVFPSAFLVAPVVISHAKWGTNRTWSSIASTPTTTSCSLGFLDISSCATGTSMLIMSFAIGRWF